MNKLSKSIAVASLFLTSFSTDILAIQPQAVRDFVFQIQSCDRIKTTITCSLTITNNGQKRLMEFYDGESKIFDNLGNEIRDSEFKFTSNGLEEKNILPDTPIKAKVVFDGVSPQASDIVSLEVVLWKPGGNVEFHDADLSFSNSQPQPQQKTVWNNFLFELQGCNKTGTTVKCSLTVTNNIKNRVLEFYGGETKMFDDLSNETRESEIKFVASGSQEKTLITGSPVPVEVVFEGVSPQASSIATLEVALWNPGGRLKFRHIPFSNSISSPSQPSTPAPTPVCIGNECGEVWSLAPEPNDTQGYTPIDRFRPDDGNLWKNPLRFQASGGFPNSFAPAPYKNAIEGFFQIRYACEADWYSGAKDLGWIPANVVGAIEYCVYPEKIQEVVNHLLSVANKLACENNLPECNQ